MLILVVTLSVTSGYKVTRHTQNKEKERKSAPCYSLFGGFLSKDVFNHMPWNHNRSYRAPFKLHNFLFSCI